MNHKIIPVSSLEVGEALDILKKELSNLDFRPNLAFIIFTTKYYGKHKNILNFLKPRFKFDTISFFADAFGTREGIFTNGFLVLLLKADFKIFKTGRGNLENELTKIADNIRGFDMALAIYPALYFPSKLGLISGFLRDRYYWGKFRRCKSDECKKKVLKSASNWIQKKRIVMPINKVLRILGNSGIPIGSVNLVPLEVHEETPIILHNFKPIKRNVLVVGFKNVDLHFKDIFPERGNSYEETKEVLKRFFAFRDEIPIIKHGVAIGEINGKQVKEYIEKKLGLKPLTDKEFIEKVEKGEFSAITPFGLAFISSYTFGVSVIGLIGYPLNIYLSLFDLENYLDSSMVLGEVFTEKPEEFVDFGTALIGENVKLLLVDSTTLLAYHGEVYKIYDFMINKKEKNWIIVFSPFPSAKFPRPLNKKLLSEVENGLYYFGSGTSILLKFHDD